MIERGELRLPEMQRRYVWRSTRVRDLLDSLYRGYPSGAKADGDEVEVIAKFSAGCERQVGGLVAESIAAILAADLDLPVPEPVLVEFDAEFVELIRLRDPALAERAGRSVPVGFGSTKLQPGFPCPSPSHADSRCARPGSS